MRIRFITRNLRLLFLFVSAIPMLVQAQVDLTITHQSGANNIYVFISRSGGDVDQIKYSITYEDGVGNESNATYVEGGNGILMDKRPATLTVRALWMGSDVGSAEAIYFGFAGNTNISIPFQTTYQAPNIVPAFPFSATVTYSSNWGAQSANKINSSTGEISIWEVVTETYSATFAKQATPTGSGVTILNDPSNGSYDLGEFTLTVTQKPLTEDMISISPACITYDGGTHTPWVDVKSGIYSFNKNYDYTVSHANDIKNVGNYPVTVTATANGKLSGGPITKTFSITARSINDAKVTLGYTTAQYTGSELKPSVSVALPSPKGGYDPPLDASNYKVTYENSTNVGTATVTVKGKGNYTGSASTTFTITARSLGNATFGTISEQTYTGSAITPEPTVTWIPATGGPGTQLVKGTDFDFSYTNNVNVPATPNAPPTITITGKGNYTGSKSKTFTIVKATPVVTAPTAKSLTYNGAAQALVNAGSTTLGTLQYSLDDRTYGTNVPTSTGVGSYTVYYRVVGDGNINDVAAQSITVTISKAAGSLSYATTSISKTFGNAAFTNPLTLTGDGTVRYSTSNASVASVNATTGEVTIAGSGSATITATVTDGTNYTYATKTASYTITVGTNVMNVTATGYTGTYDGQSHGITVTAPDGATVKYGTTAGSYTLTTSPTYTAAGSYTVYYQVSKANYTTVTGSQTVVISKAAGSLSYAATSISKTFGNAAFTNPLTLTGDGTVRYSTSNASVASVNATTGEVTIAGSGSATITATVTDGTNYTYATKTASYTITVGTNVMNVTATGYTGTYDGQSHGITVTAPDGATVKYGTTAGSYTLTTSPTYTAAGSYTVYYQVSKANYTTVTGSQTVVISKAAGSLSYAATSISKTFGNAAFTNPLTLTGDGTVRYSTSNASVASVNATTGEVTIAGSGSATITATVTDGTNYTYATKTASYTITVGTNVMNVIATGYTGTYDGQAHGITVTAPDGATVKYGETAGNYNLSASPTYINVGTYTVYYQVTKTGYTTVTGSAVVTISKAQATVRYDLYEFTAKIGEPFNRPYVTLDPQGLKLSYWSSDNDVAIVDAQTGEVTLIAPGRVNIYAEFAGDENYNRASDYYILTVLQRDIEPIDEDVTIVWKDEDFIITDADGKPVEKKLKNTVIYDILFTLDITGDPSESDGYDETDDCVVLNYPMSNRDVDNIIFRQLEPGTEAYADEYTGLTFKVSAGKGYVIIDSKTDGEYQMMAKIGNLSPIAFNHTDREKDSVFYECSSPTWVYVYNGGKVSNARMDANHRAKKQKGHVMIYSITRSSSVGDGIERINMDALEESDRWYDLQGNRINRPTKKGIYILRGQKVIVK